MSALRRLLILFAAAFTLTAFSQDSAPAATSPNMTAVFNALYPDLASHQDVVTAAMMSMTAEGFQAQTLSAAMGAAATRARTNLQRSSRPSAESSTTDPAAFKLREDAARQEALRLYPEAATPTSPLYQRISTERAKLARIYPDYFKNPDWPLMLTNGCIAAMTLESQEKRTQQQAQANQPQMSIDQAKEAVELLRMLQELKNSRARSR